MSLLQNAAKAALACAALATAACTEPLRIGDEVLWSADQETADLSQWTETGEGRTVFNPGDAKVSTLDPTLEPPSADVSISVTTEASHGGRHALKLTNPGSGDAERETGMEIFRVVGPVEDAFYSAWFLLPLDFELHSAVTIARLRSLSPEGALLNGEELQLRSLPTGGYVLQIFHNNSAFLREPLPEAAPHLTAGRWAQIEARYQPHAGGRLQVWLDGSLVYDLRGRPDPGSDDLVFSICSTGETFTPSPFVLFVDDVAVSLSRVGPEGVLHADRGR